MEWNIADLFEASVDAVPERTALVAGAKRRTYAELERRANRLAHHLAAHGISRDDHVGIHAYNCAEFVEGMLACFKLRAVPINVNYRYVEQELAYLFDNADLVAARPPAPVRPEDRRDPGRAPEAPPLRRDRRRERCRRPALWRAALRGRPRRRERRPGLRPALPGSTTTCSTRAAPTGMPKAWSGVTTT